MQFRSCKVILTADPHRLYIVGSLMDPSSDATDATWQTKFERILQAFSINQAAQNKPNRIRSRSAGLLDRPSTTRYTKPNTITLSRPSRSTKHHKINQTKYNHTFPCLYWKPSFLFSLNGAASWHWHYRPPLTLQQIRAKRFSSVLKSPGPNVSPLWKMRSNPCA